LKQGPPGAGGVVQRIAEDVARLEDVLAAIVRSDVALVREVGEHTIRAGGKRLRPAIVLLAARAAGAPFDEERAVRLGAVIETVHMATLMHDDVIDKAETRRGKPTAASLFGNTASILCGDVLLARAMSILAEDGDLGIIRTVSAAVVEMAEGEARELAARGRFDLEEEEHLRIVAMKTAALVQCCCEVGVQIAGAPPEVRRALAAFGHHLGLAFQVVDDLLDFRGDERLTGKPRGADFREGCATLPLIYLRERLTEDERTVVSRRFGDGVTEEEMAMFVSWMEARGAFDRAEALARRHARLALDALAAAPPSPERDLLEAIVGFVLERQN
jgi:octaprenyl-diphosphate synthase